VSGYSSGPHGVEARLRYDREIATRSGRASGTQTGNPKVAVVYIYPVGKPLYDSAARRFASTYREFPPQYDHSLHIIFNGEEASAADRGVFDGIQVEFHQHDDSGWDIGAFQMAAREIECDLLVCLGANSYFRRAGWLRRIADVFTEAGDGLYGGSASYLPIPHIRTGGFWCPPELIRAYGKDVRTYDDRYQFEHGEGSITKLAEHLQLGCLVVTWDGVYSEPEWRSASNIYCRGDQSNSLMYDRPFDEYEENVTMRPFFAALADGWGMVPGACILGKTNAQLLAEIESDTSDGALAMAEGPWNLLAHEVLRVLKDSARNRADAARIEREFVEELSSDKMEWLRESLLGGLGLSQEDVESPGNTGAAIRYALRLDSLTGAADDLAPPPNPWTMREGMQLSRPRQMLLQLLQPFADRQYEQDVRRKRLLALLTDEVNWLRGRVRELEASRARTEIASTVDRDRPAE